MPECVNLLKGMDKFSAFFETCNRLEVKLCRVFHIGHWAGTEKKSVACCRQESETAAVTRIRDNYPVLLSISEQADKKNASSILQMEIGNKQVKPKALSVLCSQFAITLRSGMSIARAMRMLAGQCTDKRLRKVMEEAAKEVAAGSTVAAALEKHQERFPLTFIETIRAGEQSGTLAQSFDRLHKYYDKSYKTTEKIRSALTYPMFVIAIAVVVVIVVMVKVIPTLAAVFAIWEESFLL